VFVVTLVNIATFLMLLYVWTVHPENMVWEEQDVNPVKGVKHSYSHVKVTALPARLGILL